jgi:two-component system sensor histidine kinase QseC
MTTITPYLWFDNNAEEAISLYTGLFPDARLIGEARYPEGTPMPAGTLMTATIELAGQRIMLLNGGPSRHHTEAFSLFVECDGQEEVDRYWNGLTAHGGAPGQCGWLTDPFGLSWQIIPSVFLQYATDPDPEKVQRVMGAMLQMTKFDVEALRVAYLG